MSRAAHLVAVLDQPCTTCGIPLASGTCPHVAATNAYVAMSAARFKAFMSEYTADKEELARLRSVEELLMSDEIVAALEPHAEAWVMPAGVIDSLGLPRQILLEPSEIAQNILTALRRIVRRESGGTT